MALTLNLVVIPVVAGLVAGTGAVATYVKGSATSAPIAATQSGQPCAAQTWPYIDSKCRASAPQTPVRVVMAPRADEASETVMRGARVVPPIPAPQAAIDQAAAAIPPGMVSSDGVLRQPNALTSASKPRAKRSEQRRWMTQAYQVPTETRDRRARPILVVRPIRLTPFR